MEESKTRRKQFNKKLLTKLALFSLAGGLGGFLACLAFNLTLALFMIFIPIIYSPVNGVISELIQASLVGLLLGALHSVIWDSRLIRRKAGRTILFWAMWGILAPWFNLLIIGEPPDWGIAVA